MPKSKKSKAYYALLLNREDRIRTDDPYVPNVVLYQAELLPAIKQKALTYGASSIGKTGFEPATPWSQTKCSTKLSYFPKYAPSRIRTCNRLIRSQVLYPVEPWVLYINMPRTGIEPVRCLTTAGF